MLWCILFTSPGVHAWERNVTIELFLFLQPPSESVRLSGRDFLCSSFAAVVSSRASASLPKQEAREWHPTTQFIAS